MLYQDNHNSYYQSYLAMYSVKIVQTHEHVYIRIYANNLNNVALYYMILILLDSY